MVYFFRNRKQDITLIISTKDFFTVKEHSPQQVEFLMLSSVSG